MNMYQIVVNEYLRANRSTFINTECCIQLNEGDNPDTSGPHWYCDALAVDLKQRKAFLCEVSYAKSLTALGERLKSWSANWPLLRVALERDCGIAADWAVRPWVFVPLEAEKALEGQLAKIKGMGTGEGQMPYPKQTWLQDAVPWKYRSWNRAHTED